MDKDLLVENIKKCCAIKNVSLNAALKAAGVGTSFVTNIRDRGTMPSVAKVAQLAAYLGVSTSELIGDGAEDAAPLQFRRDERELLKYYRDLNEEGREKVVGYAADLADSGKYKKHHESRMDQEA